MCGFVGVAGLRAMSYRDRLEALCDTLAHRGPDGRGVWWAANGHCGLSHKRLAILDLSATGSQPMHADDNTLAVTYNGEIYNHLELRSTLEACGHRFRGHSDTEVLLTGYKEWGTEILDRIDGMFAFAIFDAQRDAIFLARDRAGEKPLYFRLTPELLLFGSELKLFMLGPERRLLNIQSLQHYLTYGYPPADASMLQQVGKLRPAEALWYSVAEGALRRWRYWSAPTEPVPCHASVDILASELDELLHDSVSRCLIADVPVGVMLSGGLDSSLIAAMASRISRAPVKTFTMTLPGQPKFDEARYARLVAHHLGTDHVELPIDEASTDVLADLAARLDEPIGDSSIIPTFLLARLVRQHVTVALSGDAGDELFGGYRHHSWIQRCERLRTLVPEWVRTPAACLAARLPVGLPGRNHAIGCTGPLSRSIAHIDIYFDGHAQASLLNHRLRQEVPSGMAERDREMSVAGMPGSLEAMIWSDFVNYLPGDILTKVDRASMLCGLEVRAPMLSRQLMEFAFGRLPGHLKATGRQRKILLRRIASRYLPEALDLRRKQGFSIPVRPWMASSLGKMVQRTIASMDGELFDRAAVQGLLRHNGSVLNNTKRLFILTVFELWRRSNSVEVA